MVILLLFTKIILKKMKKNTILLLAVAFQINSFASVLDGRKIVMPLRISPEQTSFPMLRFSYYLSLGSTIATGTFGATRKQNTTAAYQGYDGFGIKSGYNIYTGFYFYFKKLPLPANQKLGINYTILDINFMNGENNFSGYNMASLLSTSPGIVYSYCPKKHLAIDATANMCFTQLSFSSIDKSTFSLMQEIGLSMRMRLLFVSVSFRNGKVNGVYDGVTSPDDRSNKGPSYIGSSNTTITNMSFKVNYFNFKLGVCF